MTNNNDEIMENKQQQQQQKIFNVDEELEDWIIPPIVMVAVALAVVKTY